jgi:hypothetical protein
LPPPLPAPAPGLRAVPVDDMVLRASRCGWENNARGRGVRI